MTAFRAEIAIAAPAETIWHILTDAPNYPTWDPGMIRLEGTIALGEKITAYTKLSPDRAFPVHVTEMIAPERMVWTGGMPLGLFKGVRTMTLTPQPDGAVLFTIEEVFSGLLLPLFRRTIPDLTPVFRDFAAGLKAHAEANT